MAKEVEAKVVDDDKQIVLAKPREVSTRAPPAGTVAVNPERLLMQAIKGKVAPESIKAIMDMRRELVEEQARREYYDALGAFQKDLEPILKSKVVRNRQDKIDAGEADEVRFRYAPVEKIAKAIQAGCERHGFSYDFDSERIEAQLMPVHCSIHHVGGYTTRHTFFSPVLYEAGSKIGQSPAQVFAGALTFGRRSSLVAGFGIMTADPAPEAQQGEEAKKAEESKEPATVAEAQSTKKKAAGTSETMDAVFDEVSALIDAKCKGKAAQTFLASAHKHY